jgi:tRNA (cytosine40_48-C5)-methyltransferase
MNFFIKRYEKLCEDFTKGEVKKSLRVNTLKIKPEDLAKRLRKKGVKLEKIKWLNNGYYYESEFSLGATPEYLLGLYYLQENASQKAVEVLAPAEKDLVLDMCAAPGSKTTYLSQVMSNKGQIIAIDSHNRRLKSLVHNLERMGCKNVLVYQKDAQYVDDLGLKFDKVLLDAPCSGNYALDKNWFLKRDIDGIKNNARTQKNLIRAGLRVLKKGGTLVYSTCSLEPEENEMTIDWALEKFNIELIELNNFGIEAYTEFLGKKVNSEIKKCRRLWPHLHGSGFFVAKMKLL